MTANVLPSPDFTCVKPGCSYRAGVRPYRTGTFRLEPETIGGKFVVHNYGHGGAGITMSWGCADEVLRLVRAHSAPGSGKSVAVIGAGVMGLTAATLLCKEYQVSIYAERLTGTTSDVAGGQWAPSVVEFDHGNPNARKRFEDLLRVAFRTHQRLGQGFGVSPRVNYTKRRSATFEKVPRDLIPLPPRKPLPFAGLSSPGYGYETLLVEPPIFLKRLREDLAASGVLSSHKAFTSVDEILALSEPIIVNCTGLGAGTLFKDPAVIPIKGQLVLLPAQPNLTWLYSTDHTYVFPRADCVVVGGSYELNEDDENPVPRICEQILQMAEDVFSGKPLAREFRATSWLMRNK